AFSRARVKRLHMTNWIRELHAIRDLAAEDDQVFVDKRGRTLGVVQRIIRHPRQRFRQRNPTVVPERLNGLSGFCIQAEKLVTAVEENADVVAIAPERGAAQLPPARGQKLSELVSLSVETPQLFSALGIERCDVVVRRRDVEDAVDHQRRTFELTRKRLV